MSKPKILLNFFHPNIDNSRGNKILIESVITYYSSFGFFVNDKKATKYRFYILIVRQHMIQESRINDNILPIMVA
jgi:hypothetical protein